MHNKRRADEMHQKIHSRKKLKTLSGRGLTLEDELQQIKDKMEKKELDKKIKKYNNFMRLWRMKRNEMHTKGVIARKAERGRVKKIKEFKKQNAFIPIELTTPIQDPEAEWKASNVTWKEEEAKKEKAKKKYEGMDGGDENEVTFVLDTEGDDSLRRQEDYIPFYQSMVEDEDTSISSDDDINI